MRVGGVERIHRRHMAPTLARVLLAVVLLAGLASLLWKEWEVSEPADVLSIQGKPMAVDGAVLAFERMGSSVTFSVELHTGKVGWAGRYLVEAIIDGRVVGATRFGGEGLVRIPAAGIPVHAMLAQFDQHYAEAVATWVEVENMPGEEDVDWQASKWAQWRWGNFAADTDEARKLLASYVTFRLRDPGPIPMRP